MKQEYITEMEKMQPERVGSKSVAEDLLKVFACINMSK